MENNSSSFNQIWSKKASRIGRTMILCTMIATLTPLAYLKFAYGVFPELSVAISAWLTVAAVFGVYYFIEPLSYYPVLGLSGTYMAFTVGSIADIRMPAAAVAQESVGVQYGSDEGSVVATIGIAGSLITSLSVVFITAVAGTTLISFLPDWLTDALRMYIVPAIFGAIYVQFCKFQPKLSFMIVVSTIVYLLLSHIYGLMMITCVIVAVLIARLLYIKGYFGPIPTKEKQKEELKDEN